MNVFTIKDLENLTGIKAHTIRIWEQRYNFLKPNRTDTNIRNYSSNELKTVLNIALLNKYGFKISHINKMNEEQMQEKILSLSHAQAQQERIINELIQNMVDIQLAKFETVIEQYIYTKGIERTITQIIFPFLERIGVLWLTNHINPAQEHLVTNIIRQKLIVGIDGIKTNTSKNKSLLLFLPEGEHHELGLLFMCYLLKKRGLSVIYLGANVPLKDISYIAELKKPNYIYAHLTSVAHNFNFEKFLTNSHLKLSNHKVVISGLLTSGYRKEIPSNIEFKRSLPEVMDYIASL